MVYASDAGRARGLSARPFRMGLLPDTGDEPDETRPRDLKKIVLIVGLGTLSWVATYIGMLELIQANMGDLPLIHKVIIGFSVAMLMTMIVWLLDQMFAPIGAATRLAYIAGYLFLSLISVGFGFGFYWKVLESRSESSRSAETAVTAVQSSLNAASTRLEQLNATLTQLTALSREKAEIERTKGTSCPNSKPGDGPRRRMRDEDAARFAFASEFVSGRVAAVKADMAALDGDLARIVAGDPATIDPKTGTRNEFMRALGRKLDMTVSGFNAVRTDPQLKQLRQDLADRADRTAFGDPKSGGFSCPDTELAQALRGAVRAIGELPVLEKPAIAAVEGSEATIEAFRRLTTTFYGALAFKLPPSADELRELQKKAIQSVENSTHPLPAEAGGLSTRDYVPLAVAIFVDICLFLVSIGRPVHGLQGLMPRMRDAERGPVIEILSRFNDIHRDPEIRESFEIFRHVVFDVHGAYYVAVPLDAPPHVGPERADELRIEAQLLANLFTSFEKDRIFKRTWTPFTHAVQRKLARQGSKFAEVEAFRIYKFRDGAWPEIILGAVMGAARRAEAEARRRRIERDLLTPREPTLAFEPRQTTTRPRADHEPMTAAAPPRERTVAPRRTAQEPAPSDAAEPELPRKPVRHRNAKRTTVFASDVFGPYARSAEAELAEALETDDDQEPEDRPPAEVEVPSATRNGEPRESAASRNVDVVLKRETATVSLPLDEAIAPDGLMGRLERALAGNERGAESTAAVTLPLAPSAHDTPADANQTIGQQQYDSEAEHVEAQTESEHDADATTAGWLRPATDRA